ncbi:MAG: DNRLRE domain-containing protein, partial [Oscillospiraceae bacterium]|nr:DNRLRE domain-containing protein [Oscillospiraceae bacterium]
MNRIVTKSITSILAAALITQISAPAAAAVAEDIRNRPRRVDFSRPAAVSAAFFVEDEKEPVLREPEPYYETDAIDESRIVAADDSSVTLAVAEDSFVTEVGGEKTVFLDEQDNVQSVDNTLVQAHSGGADVYENAAGVYRVELPAELTENRGIRLTRDGRTVELRPAEGDFSQSVVNENALLYNNVFPGIDYQYTVLGRSLKEDIVLRYPQERYEFRYEVSAQGLQIAETEGAIAFYAEDMYSPEFLLSAPAMLDASGAVSRDIYLSLSEEDGKYIVTLRANAAWLNALERAYPVRLDPELVALGDSDIDTYTVKTRYPNLPQGSSHIYVGYDDGYASGNNSDISNSGLFICRTFVAVNYDFSQIPEDAVIESAVFKLYQISGWSGGNTTIGVYRPDEAWSSGVTWDMHTGFTLTDMLSRTSTSAAAGAWLELDVSELVAGWVHGEYDNTGFVLIADDDSKPADEAAALAQAEEFANSRLYSQYAPVLEINWSRLKPIAPNEPSSEEINLRPMTEKDNTGKQLFDAVFGDSLGTPGAVVSYKILEGRNTAAGTPVGSGSAVAAARYLYPNSKDFEAAFPNANRYRRYESNWQTALFTRLGLEYDKIYHLTADVTKDGASVAAKSDNFLIYQVKQHDTVPFLAKHYGVEIDTIKADNNMRDSLLVKNNTIFIRNPQTDEPYNPPPLTEDQMREIDAALMGRGLHCEYGFEPINFNTGNFILEAQDAVIPDLGGDFALERTFNSKGEAVNSLFGRRWSFKYSEYLYQEEDGRIGYVASDGKTLLFTPSGGGGYTSPAGYFLTLERLPYTGTENVETIGTDADGEEIINVSQKPVTLYTWRITDKTGEVKEFSVYGLLTSVTTAGGLTTSLSYDSSLSLSGITSPSGKSYGIATDSFGRISAVTLPNTKTLRYEYDAAGNLIRYTDAEGEAVIYTYDAQHRITQWFDQNGTRIIANTYDAQGR